MHVAGIGLPGGVAGRDGARRTRAEWAVRMPFCLMGVLGIYAVYLVTCALRQSRRAGVLAAVVLATAPMYSLVARQAMTDMAFVGPMAMALALGALALFDDDDELLPRRGARRALARAGPHHPLFYGDAGAVRGRDAAAAGRSTRSSCRWSIPVGRRDVKMYGAVVMIPYYRRLRRCSSLLAARTRYKAPLYLYIAAILCGLAMLAKGLAGLGLPVIVFVAYLAFTWNWRRLQRAQLRYGDRRVAGRLRGGRGPLAPRDADPPRRAVLERAVRRQPLAAHGDRAPRRSRHVRVLPARARLRRCCPGSRWRRRRWAGR